MSTARDPKARPARATADDCESLHRPIRSLSWQLFAGFVAVLLTLTLAGAAHLASKADADELQRVERRAAELERTLSEIHSRLAELRTGQELLRDEVRYIRTTLDKERDK